MPRRHATALGLCALLVLLAAGACTSFSPIKGNSLQRYSASTPRGIELILSRDASTIFGTWEEADHARYGLVEGNSRVDGGIKLTFFAAATSAPVGRFEGSYLGSEKAFEGSLSLGSSEVTTLRFEEGPKLALRQGSLQAQSRRGLPTTAEAGRFWSVAFEPSRAGVLRSAYRRIFQEGRSLSAAMAKAKDGVMEDFGAAAEGNPESAQAWVYDARQFPSFVSDYLLVLGLRVGVVSGGRVLEQSLRYAVLDAKDGHRLSPGDFLVQGWEGRLPELLARASREELGLPEDASLSAAGLTLDLPVPSPDFFVYSKGLGFHYPPGALAPDEAGEFFILLPFDRLGEDLKPGILSTYQLGGGKGK